MKRAVLILFLVVCLAAVLAGLAASTLLVGSMSSVNGTNNSASVSLSTFLYPRGTFLIQNGGLNNTNDLLVRVQISLDNTNFITVATYQPSGTNATLDTFSPPYSAGTIYLRTQVVTTNAINVATVFQN